VLLILQSPLRRAFFPGVIVCVTIVCGGGAVSMSGDDGICCVCKRWFMNCRCCGQETDNGVCDNGCVEPDWSIGWTPADEFSAPGGSVVLHRHKSRELGHWVYALDSNWDPTSFARWGVAEDTEYVVIESR